MMHEHTWHFVDLLKLDFDEKGRHSITESHGRFMCDSCGDVKFIRMKPKEIEK